MIRVYIRKDGEPSGHVFKSRASIMGDKVAMLPWIGFVSENLITEDEWAKSQQSIISRFKLYVKETKLDGRGKLAKQLKYFSWRRALEPSPSKALYI